jgi:hypothetical protein
MGSEMSLAASEFSLSALPEWYRMERETERTIQKLGTLKELDYYLGNPDEYIRRLAILRLLKLSAKESSYKLAELLDNPAESDENKFLAAWVLKKLTGKRASDFFLYNKYLDQFDGSESYEDLFPIAAEDRRTAVRFDFSSSESCADLKLGSEEPLTGRDAVFETAFDFKQWFSFFATTLSKSASSGFKTAAVFVLALPVLLGKGTVGLFKKIKQNRAVHKEARIKKAAETFEIRARKRERKARREEQRVPEYKRRASEYNRQPAEYGLQVSEYGLRLDRAASGDYRNWRRELYGKPGLLSLLKKGGFQMLYFLFAPFRFVRRNKLAVLCFIVAAYLVLAYTEYGRAFSYKYFSYDLRNIPQLVLQKAKYYSTIGLLRLNQFTGMDEYQGKYGQSEYADNSEIPAGRNGNAFAADGKPYLVTAKKGLNIREAPDAGSSRVGAVPLEYGTTVLFLSQSQKDASGTLWYYVEATDGRTGWVSARYLKEKKEG